MADITKDVEVNIKGKDETEKAFKNASKNASIFKKDIKDVNDILATLAKRAVALFTVNKAIQFIGGSIEEYDTKIQYATKLEYLLKKTTQATDEQVKSLLDQASALQEVGVVSDDVVVALQGQLATFELSSSTIEKMTPAILDMVVAEKGVNATTEDMIEFGNAFGMALEGNYAALTRRGFKIDENTKKIIELGTEEQKADAITKYLTDTYGGLNEVMRQTSQGEMQAMKNSFGDFREQVGEMSSFFRNELVDDFYTFFSKTLNMGGDWAKDLSYYIYGLKEVSLSLPRILGASGLGLMGGIKQLITGNDELFGKSLIQEGVNMLGRGTESWSDIYYNFEEKWKKTSNDIITPLSRGGANVLPDLATDSKDVAKKIDNSFQQIAKSIVSSFNEQESAIRNLRKELDNLEKDTEEQLNKADQRYQEDLKNKAKQSKERIEQIDKEIEDTRRQRNQGWRTRIEELEAEKQQEQNILKRIGGEVSNLNEELAKDDLTIMKEKLEAEKALILQEAEKTKAEKETEIEQRTAVQLRGAVASLSPDLMNTLIAENKSFLGQIEAGPNQYIFTFNGDINDENKLITTIINALNRQATLRGVAGK